MVPKMSHTTKGSYNCKGKVKHQSYFKQTNRSLWKNHPYFSMPIAVKTVKNKDVYDKMEKQNTFWSWLYNRDTFIILQQLFSNKAMVY